MSDLKRGKTSRWMMVCSKEGRSHLATQPSLGRKRLGSVRSKVTRLFLLLWKVYNITRFAGWVFAGPLRSLLYKWKNHFSEMKGDVGMSVHKKEGKQEDA